MDVRFKRVGDSLEIKGEFRVPVGGHYAFHTAGSGVKLPIKLMRSKTYPHELFEIAEISKDTTTFYARVYNGSKNTSNWGLVNKNNFIELDKNDLAKVLYENDVE